MKTKVEFDAHRTMKRPVEVKFKTRAGERVDFVADKRVKVPVHVKFKVERPEH